MKKEKTSHETKKKYETPEIHPLEAAGNIKGATAACVSGSGQAAVCSSGSSAPGSCTTGSGN